MTINRFKDLMAGRCSAATQVLMLVGLSVSGCASSGSNPQVQRSDEEATVRMLECPDEKKPTCIRRMGTIQECTCNTNADFRKAWNVNL